MTKTVKPGVPFTIGAIACMKCPSCGVTRELSQFWKHGRCNKPAAATTTVCTYCR